MISFTTASSPWDRWLGAFGANLVRMLEDTFAPTDLVVDVTLEPLSLAGSLLVVALLAALGFASWRHRSATRGLGLVGLVIAVAAAALTAPLLLQFGFVSDRYAYPCLVGVALFLIGWAEPAFALLAPRMPALTKRPALLGVGLPAAIVLVALPFTWAQELTWQSNETLQANMFRARPADPQSQLAEGVRRMKAGDSAGSYPLCQAYAEHFPSSDRADFCLGDYLLRHGQPREAAMRFERYLRERPYNAPARMALEVAEAEATRLNQ
jgi:hypothetical protein